MAQITLKQDGSFDATYVPNAFIDKYMTRADGEFVKIYLYLLRCVSHQAKTLSVSDIADRLDHTERDVHRALKYWEKLNLLQLEYENDALCAICLTQACVGTDALAAHAQVHSFVNVERAAHTKAQAASYTGDPGVSKEQLAHLSEDETVQELMFIAERYLGHELNCEESRAILYWLDNLGFSQDMIDYLLEYCVAKDRTNIKYMNKIALEWSKQGIQTLTEAKEAIFRNSELVHAIMRAYGICGRTLADIELEFVREWLRMGFSNEMIVAACQKTITSVQKASFGYTNKILQDWESQNVHTLDDIRLSDAQFQEANRKKYSAAKQAAVAAHARKNSPAGTFYNFTQRTYDYGKMEQDLLTR